MTTTYSLPDFEPSVSTVIEITSSQVYGTLIELDRELIGGEDYLGLAKWWSSGRDDYYHILKNVSSFKRKRIHDVLVHNKIPLAQPDRDFGEQELASEIYRRYL